MAYTILNVGKDTSPIFELLINTLPTPITIFPISLELKLHFTPSFDTPGNHISAGSIMNLCNFSYIGKYYNSMPSFSIVCSLV